MSVKLSLAIGALAVSTTAAGVTAIITEISSSSTKVLGTKVIGSGGSSASPNANGKGNNGNGNGGNSGSAGKTFVISGTVEGLYPGGTTELHLTVASDLNQAMTVESLSASLSGVIKAVGAPAGTCDGPVTIGSWTGSSFDVAENSSVSAPGYIPLTLASSAPDACKGATFNLHYSGTAVQK
jgi:hypothetical protein